MDNSYSVESVNAPAVVFAYNRPLHTQKMLSSLKRNYLAAQTDLHVYCDGPKSESDLANVTAVRELFHNLSGFKSVTIVASELNRGLAESVISGVSEAINTAGKVIVIEDDLELSPYFLSFMNFALDKYREANQVFSIGGYQFPSKTMEIPDGYTYDTYTAYRACSWGWATWADRWNKVDWDVSDFKEFVRDEEAVNAFNQGGIDLSQSLKDQMNGRIDSWAIRFCYGHFRAESYCVYPTRTLVRNIGLDSSGVHCGVDPTRDHDIFDEDWHPSELCPVVKPDMEIAKRFAMAFDPRRFVTKSYFFELMKNPRNLTARIITFLKIRWTISSRMAKRK